MHVNEKAEYRCPLVASTSNSYYMSTRATCQIQDACYVRG